MNLYYHKSENGNFGDDLNPWLWNKLLPSLEELENDVFFIGIGTLLNHRLPKEKKIIFGSGYGYGTPPIVDDNWNVYALRGYTTAKVLGLDENLVITDAAVLLKLVDYPTTIQKYKIGFMPHERSSWLGDWDSICNEMGLHFIDAAWPVDKVLLEMQSCECLITEAMHGAIVADTLRIPWTPVVMYDYILASKWHDWLSTMEMEYTPQTINPIWNVDRHLDWQSNLKGKLKRNLIQLGINSQTWTPPFPKKSIQHEYDKAKHDIANVLRVNQFFLSNDNLLDKHIERYVYQLDKFKRDYSI